MVNRVFPYTAQGANTLIVTKLGPGKIIIVFMCKVFSTLVLSYFRRIAYIYYTEMIAFHFSFLYLLTNCGASISSRYIYSSTLGRICVCMNWHDGVNNMLGYLIYFFRDLLRNFCVACSCFGIVYIFIYQLTF